jgi:hypothetical protein
MSLTDHEVREQVERLDAMLARIDAIVDTHVQELVIGTIQALLDLYGEGLARIAKCVAAECAQSGRTTLGDALVADELVSHLLLLHELHPDMGPTLIPLQRAHHRVECDVVGVASDGGL